MLKSDVDLGSTRLGKKRVFFAAAPGRRRITAERLDEGGIDALREAKVIAGLLPACFYLGVLTRVREELFDEIFPLFRTP